VPTQAAAYPDNAAVANAGCDGGYLTTASVEACSALSAIVSELAAPARDEEPQEEPTNPATTDAPITVSTTEPTVPTTASETTDRVTISTTADTVVTDPTEAVEEDNAETPAPNTGFFEGRDAKWIAMFSSGCVAALVGITMLAVVSQCFSFIPCM
jgi:hypothetical protein